MAVKQIYSDITQCQADVIINAANTENMHGGGVDLAIARAAGRVYKNAANETNGVPMGQYLVSPAGDLKAKVIIDIPTIDLVKAEKISLQQLQSVWRDVLAYCQQQGYKTIATPLLGAGVVGFTRKEIINILTDTANHFPNLDVTIVIFPN